MIKFLADYDKYKIGQTVSLTPAEEASLVASTVATTNTAGGTPYADPLVDIAKRDQKYSLVTSAQLAAIMAAGIPADKALQLKVTDTTPHVVYFWNGTEYTALGSGGSSSSKNYEGASGIAIVEQSFAAGTYASPPRLVPLNANIESVEIRNDTGFIIQAAPKFGTNFDINPPTTGYLDIPVGGMQTWYQPNASLWARFKTSGESTTFERIRTKTRYRI